MIIEITLLSKSYTRADGSDARTIKTKNNTHLLDGDYNVLTTKNIISLMLAHQLPHSISLNGKLSFCIFPETILHKI